ncbi:hypothetical protein THAOC_25982, partial [Thalassiosira oceanica]
MVRWNSVLFGRGHFPPTVQDPDFRPGIFPGRTRSENRCGKNSLAVWSDGEETLSRAVDPKTQTGIGQKFSFRLLKGGRGESRPNSEKGPAFVERVSNNGVGGRRHEPTANGGQSTTRHRHPVRRGDGPVGRAGQEEEESHDAPRRRGDGGLRRELDMPPPRHHQDEDAAPEADDRGVPGPVEHEGRRRRIPGRLRGGAAPLVGGGEEGGSGGPREEGRDGQDTSRPVPRRRRGEGSAPRPLGVEEGRSPEADEGGGAAAPSSSGGGAGTRAGPTRRVLDAVPAVPPVRLDDR